MRRSFVLVLMIMTFMSQVLAITGRADAPARGQADAHATLHWKGAAHHHLDDGSLNHGDSKESTKHLLFYELLTAPGLVSSLLPSLPAVTGQPPSSLDEPAVPDPWLPRLKRPPRPLA